MSPPFGASADLLASVAAMKRRTWNDELAAEFERGEAYTRRASTGFNRYQRRQARHFSPRRPQRSPDRQKSTERRRMLGGSGVMPDKIRCHYTEGERAVLCVVATEVKRQGICDLCIDEIAARAGVSRTTAQNALRIASGSAHKLASRPQGLNHVTIEHRPVRGRKSDTNVVRIISTEWLAWIDRGPSPTLLRGFKSLNTTKTVTFNDTDAGENGEPAKESGQPSREAIRLAAEFATIAGHSLDKLPTSWKLADPERLMHGYIRDLAAIGVSIDQLRSLAVHVMRRKPERTPPHSIRYFGAEIERVIDRARRSFGRFHAADPRG